MRGAKQTLRGPTRPLWLAPDRGLPDQKSDWCLQACVGPASSLLGTLGARWSCLAHSLSQQTPPPIPAPVPRKLPSSQPQPVLNPELAPATSHDQVPTATSQQGPWTLQGLCFLYQTQRQLVHFSLVLNLLDIGLPSIWCDNLRIKQVNSGERPYLLPRRQMKEAPGGFEGMRNMPSF